MIVLIATYRGKPGTGDTIEPLLAELAAATRVEPGCLLYLVNRSTTAADTFVLYEHYVDADALAAHRDSPHFQRIGVGQVIPMLEERVFDVYRLVEGRRPKRLPRRPRRRLSRARRRPAASLPAQPHECSTGSTFARRLPTSLRSGS